MHQIHLHLPYLSQIIKNVRPIVSAGSTGTELWKTRDQYIKHQGGGGGGGADSFDDRRMGCPSAEKDRHEYGVVKQVWLFLNRLVSGGLNPFSKEQFRFMHQQ